MKRAFAIVGACLLASIVMVSIAATKQGLTLRAIPKPGSGTAVEFNLPKASEVNLSIYDITGKRIKDIVQGQYLVAGEHSYIWDGRNDQGEQVGNGIYFVNLRAGKEYRSCKLTYMKAAKGAVISSKPYKITAEEIPVKEILPRPPRDDLENFRIRYEQDVRKLAKAMAEALDRLEPALWEAMEASTDKITHKIQLESFIDATMSKAICVKGYIHEVELRDMVNAYSDLLYMEIICKHAKNWKEIQKVTKGKIEVIAVRPPRDETEWQVVYAYNTKGEELRLAPGAPPSFPIFWITFEPPSDEEFVSEAYETPRTVSSEIRGAKSKAEIHTDTTYCYHCTIYRDCEWGAMEIKTKYWTDFGGAPSIQRSTSLGKVNNLCYQYTYTWPGTPITYVVEVYLGERHYKVAVWEDDRWPDEPDFVGEYIFDADERQCPPNGEYYILDGSANGSYCDTTWVGDDILDAKLYLVCGVEYE